MTRRELQRGIDERGSAAAASPHAPPAATSTALAPDDAALEAVASVARTLEPVPPHERRYVVRNAAGLLLDALLTRVARGRGALEVALGEALLRLSQGDRLLRLGFSSVRDYARERLGTAGASAQSLVRLASALRERPVLDEAVRSGALSVRQAQVLVPVARGEAAAGWVARAQTLTVRQLAKAVREDGAEPPEEDERWTRVEFGLGAAEQAVVEEALALAGKLLGAATPLWARLEAICQEYLSSFPAPEPAPGQRPEDAVWHVPLQRWREEWKDELERQTRWAFLHAVETYAAPAPPASDDPADLDAECRRLAAARDRWDEVLGHLALLMRMLGLWRDAQFASFGHYCSQRLGMAQRTVEQRIWLERRLYELPELRAALRTGEVSYEKARVVVGVATAASLPRWLERARGATCLELRHEADAHERTQMCEAGRLRVRAPARLVPLLGEVVWAARAAAAGGWLTPGEGLLAAARHFLDTWSEAAEERNTVQKRVLERDGGMCRVPGCSRAAVHAHHIVFRSRGGTDDEWNLVSLCAAHHLIGIHRGYLRVRGRAPDALVWELPLGGEILRSR